MVEEVWAQALADQIDELSTPSIEQCLDLAIRYEDHTGIAALIQRSTTGGGGPGTPLEPQTMTLGPYTVDDVDGFTDSVDLGENTLGIIREAAFVCTALDFDGGDPENGFTADFDVSFNGTTWAHVDALPDRPNVIGQQPGGFQAPGTVRTNCVIPRYVRIGWLWAGDQGTNASATFHVDLIYF